MHAKLSSRLRSVVCSIIFFAFAFLVYAQAPRHSANTVGYADVSFSPGTNFVANPFNGTDNTISNLFRDLPDGSFFLSWDFQWGPAPWSAITTNSYSQTNGWTNPSAKIALPNGGCLWLPAPRQISFAGETWPSPFIPWNRFCEEYPPGCWLLSVMPGRYVCGIFECYFEVPPDTFMMKWNRTTQAEESYSYVGVQAGYPTGWMDGNSNPADPQLAPSESAVFCVPEPFPVCGAANTGTQSIGSVRVELTHDGTNTILRFPAAQVAHYAILGSSNLSSNTWAVVQEGTAFPSGGVASVTLPAASNSMAFYRLFPTVPSPVLKNASRIGTQFQFQFHAFIGSNYQVQRNTNLNAPVWQTILSAAPGTSNEVTVTDTNATAAAAHYRLQY